MVLEHATMGTVNIKASSFPGQVLAHALNPPGTYFIGY